MENAYKRAMHQYKSEVQTLKELRQVNELSNDPKLP